ncbi:MAG: hypothetical protein IJ936_03565, partial [Peptococcaceae bacterium]|nr:hypothetical protein [Peptococcaceae bacterium]
PLIRTCGKAQFWQLFSTRRPDWKLSDFAKSVELTVSKSLALITFTTTGAILRVEYNSSIPKYY